MGLGDTCDQVDMKKCFIHTKIRWHTLFVKEPEHPEHGHILTMSRSGRLKYTIPVMLGHLSCSELYMDVAKSTMCAKDL